MNEKKKSNPNAEKIYECMLDIDRFMMELQNKWDAKTLMMAMCWNLGKWIALSKGDASLHILKDCIDEIIWSLIARRKYDSEKEGV